MKSASPFSRTFQKEYAVRGEFEANWACMFASTSRPTAPQGPGPRLDRMLQEGHIRFASQNRCAALFEGMLRGGFQEGFLQAMDLVVEALKSRRTTDLWWALGCVHALAQVEGTALPQGMVPFLVDHLERRMVSESESPIRQRIFTAASALIQTKENPASARELLTWLACGLRAAA